MMFSCVVRYDIGFAPNPFFGWCSLACCKPDIRAKAHVGDMVVGTSSAAGGREPKFVYAMRVTEILDFNSYWSDGRFIPKRPNLSGSKKQIFGDNIYHQNASGSWLQEDSRHTNLDGTTNSTHMAKDTGTDKILLSNDFIYWGGNGRDIPCFLRQGNCGDDIVKTRQGTKNRFSSTFVSDFEDWFDSIRERGFKGRPTDWSESILKSQLL